MDFPDVHPEVIYENENHPYSAMDCFMLFMGKDMVGKMCEWTNARANKFFVDNSTKSKKCFMGRSRRDVTISELYVFICLQLLMGITKLPKIPDYWSSSFLCRGPPVFCGAIMSRNRFQQILRFVRYSDPANADRKEPMSRFEGFFKMLRENCMLYFSAGDNFAVDESLTLYKGRLHFRQYIKSKRKHFGLKLFSLCPSDPAGKGYTWNFCLYTPGLYDQMREDPELAVLSKSERVPVYLMKTLLNQGRHIILNDWYSSMHLSEYLLERGTVTTGTLRVDRGVPTIMKQQKVKPSQAVFARKGDVLLVKYNDRKLVLVITSKFQAGYVEQVHYLRGGKKERR